MALSKYDVSHKSWPVTKLNTTVYSACPDSCQRSSKIDDTESKHGLTHAIIGVRFCAQVNGTPVPDRAAWLMLLTHPGASDVYSPEGFRITNGGLSYQGMKKKPYRDPSGKGRSVVGLRAATLERVGVLCEHPGI
jgi:hypothetical protein